MASACAILPSDCELSMKKLAQALGGKSAQMMAPADAERLTGYKVGGISPFGQVKPVPVALHAGALDAALVYVNGGQRGLQVRVAPQDIVKLLGAVAAELGGRVATTDLLVLGSRRKLRDARRADPPTMQRDGVLTSLGVRLWRRTDPDYHQALARVVIVGGALLFAFSRSTPRMHRTPRRSASASSRRCWLASSRR